MAEKLPAGAVAPLLLEWFHQNRRPLPFRLDPSPYHIWISEIMLQQTQVATALPYYERFIAELPDIAALAGCDEGRLLKLWEGLGYYSRARNLQKAARVVMERHGGELPASYEALLALPGIGPYTAGAVASIAFGLPEVAVDGNVLRVMARLTADDGDIAQPDAKRRLGAEARHQLPPDAPGPYNEALMELGALVCVPGTPRCGSCPLAGICLGFEQNIAEKLPVKAKAPAKKELPVCVLLVRRAGDGALLLGRRPPGGLLAGLWGLPSFEGKFKKAEAAALLAELLPGAAPGRALPKAAHVFTHRVWRLYGWECAAPAGAAAPAGWVFAAPGELRGAYAVPGAFRAYIPAEPLQNNYKKIDAGGTV
ncbi:A/G-specific adenine glycosylase [Ruminococcaceae bacterium OttesenSCG-928-D13]|nr:A/G-specific adenine glycosylase [Ruminococcaceae bacterium OttesenSCG-928-D13]